MALIQGFSYAEKDIDHCISGWKNTIQQLAGYICWKYVCDFVKEMVLLRTDWFLRLSWTQPAVVKPSEANKVHS